MSEKFEVGEIVQLKSGGPAMTISKLHEAGYKSDTSYTCTWFKGASLERGVFVEDSLQKYEAPKKA